MSCVFAEIFVLLQLIPLFVALGAGVLGAGYYTLRLAVRNPDLTWDRKKNPEPWQEYAEKQYKVLKFIEILSNRLLSKDDSLQFFCPSGFKPSPAPKFSE